MESSLKPFEKQFLPFQPSVDMKDLGFDKICLGLYIDDKTFFPRQCTSHNEFYGQVCAAPLWQQAFHFFEEKYKLHCTIEHYVGEFAQVNVFFYRITDMVHPRRYEEYPIELFRGFNESLTKKEAMLKAVLKLIEIVKNKK